MYSIEIIDSLERFYELKQDWERLYRLREHSIFFCFEYMQTFFQVILENFKNVRVSIFVVKDASGKIIAIFPFVLEKMRFCFFLHLKILYLKDFSLIPFNRFLIDPTVDVKHISEELIEYLKQQKFWDILRWHHIPMDEPYFNSFYEEFSKNFLLETTVTETLVIDVNMPFQEYLRDHVKKKDVKEFQRQYRRLGRLGSINLMVCTTRDSIAQGLTRFYEIEDKNWKGRRGTSLLQTHQGVFFKKIVDLPLWDQKVHLFFLQVGHNSIAGFYAFIDEGVCYLLKAGYDETYSTYSPSTVLYYLLFERLFNEGVVHQIDFIGDFYSYERHFGSTTRKHNNVFVYTKRPLTQLYRLLSKRIIPFLTKCVDHVLHKPVLR
jgi:CelD/BcsL family acetyltransferase involved in cellulose biosynthesis